MPFFLLHQKFLETAERVPRKTALQIRESETGYKKYTYAEALSIAKKLGFYFIRQGIKKQDRVALILENGPLWPVFYFGILFAGAAAVPIDPQLTEEEIKNILADSEAKLAINRINANELLNNLEELPKDFNFPKLEIEDTASILYTSGTTAQPKGVELTHKNFSGNFNSLEKVKICNEKDTVISVLPLHHSYAFMITLLMPLCLGGTITYVRTLKPDEILSAMKETGVTVMVGVPQLYYLFHKGILEKIKGVPRPIGFLLKPFISKKIREGFGAKLRFFVSGGARLDPKTARELAGFGFTILEGYGLTETSPVATFNPLRRQKFGSVGVAIPDVEIKISNPDKEGLPAGKAGIGEVLIRGPNVMKGYYKRQKETDEVIKDGWFYSGDLGYIDKDGYLFLTGRRKEVIVLSSGKNIYPEEIEAHYRKSPFIKELCVMGILKGGAADELGAVIVPDTEFFKKTGEVNIREKIKWDLENFSKAASPYKRIMDFVVAKEDLPKTRLGKIKRYEVEKVYGRQFGGQRTEDRGQRTDLKGLEILNSEVGRKITKFIRENKGIKGEIGINDHLELDLGIDSLGRVELAVGLEKLFNIKIPDKDMAQIFTVKEVILKINEILEGRPGPREGAAAVPDQATWQTILLKDPAEKIQAKIDLSPSVFGAIAVFLGFGLLRLIFRLFFNLKAAGRKNIPSEGPFILCPNHSSYLDAFVVASSVPFACGMKLFFLGFKAYFSNPMIRNLIRLMKVIPVDPAAELVNAIQASGFVIRNKKLLCIFPEGQRSIDGEVKEFKKGIGILAKELNAALVPVYIEGAFNAWPRGQKFPKTSAIKIVFGEPFSVEYLAQAGRNLGANDDYEAIAIGLRQEVLKLHSR